MRLAGKLLELPAKDSGDRQFVMALARGLEILRAFTPDDLALGNQEIAKRTGIPKPTVSRLTYTLTRLGYLEYVPKLEQYRLGASVLALGYAFLSSMDAREIARASMQEIAELALGSVALTSRDRLHMIYRDVRHSSRSVRVRLDVGSRIPVGTSAAGMAALSGLPADERDFLLDAIRGRFPETWPLTERLVNETAEQIDRQGYCVVRGGVYNDSVAIGTPFAAPDGTSVLAFNCASLMRDLPDDRISGQIGPMMVDMAHTVRQELIRRHFGSGS